MGISSGSDTPSDAGARQDGDHWALSYRFTRSELELMLSALEHCQDCSPRRYHGADTAALVEKLQSAVKRG